jgi:hypothetical protein
MSNIPVTAEDLYLYAMQLLDEAEQQRLEEFLKQSPEARAELANVRSDLGMLAMTVESHAPSASSRQRLLKEMAREPRTVPSTTSATQTADTEAASASDLRKVTPIRPESYEESVVPLPVRSSSVDDSTPTSRGFFSTVTPWLGWAVAAAMTITAWDFYRKNEAMNDQVAFANATSARAIATSAEAQTVLDTIRSGAAQRFVLTKQNTQPNPSARVTYLAENGSLVFQGSNLESLPPSKTYELWLIPVGEGRKPIPAGTFKPDGHGFASILLPDLPKGVVAGTFGVTMEDDGGAQTPTLPILMIGS